MKIFVINNDGCGFAAHVEVTAGTTVQQLFQKQLPDRSSDDYLIRVNRLPVPSEQVLAEGDRVSLTARKIAGA